VVSYILLTSRAGKFFAMSVFHEVKLAANNRLNALFVCFSYKFEGTKHIAVVGEGNTPLAVIFGLGHHIADAGSAVEQRKLRVAVKMQKLGHESMILLFRNKNSKDFWLQGWFLCRLRTVSYLYWRWYTTTGW
jgi:hypothetical protein